MTRQQLEHIIRAAGAVTDELAILVLGSQSILGSVETTNKILTESHEADVYPLNAPEKTDLISSSIGEITQFQETFGYYAHGLSPESCPLPTGWEKRLHILQNENTRGIKGLCLDPRDLAASKLAAGREKDLIFVSELVRHKIVQPVELKEFVALLPEQNSRTNATRSIEIVEGRLRPPSLLDSFIKNAPSKSKDQSRGRDGIER